MLDDEIIIDLNELSNSPTINNSDIILSILEICTFNKRYNYECSNNTKSFWDRVVKEEILKKIFKNFKPETLRKYWKIIREAGDNNKYIETIRNYSKFINNPKFKLLQVINCISSFIKSGEEDFKKYFSSFDSKQKFNNDISSSYTNANTNLNEQNYRNDELFNKIQDENDLQINNENNIDNNSNIEKNTENDNNNESENINNYIGENINNDNQSENINNSIENYNNAKVNDNDDEKKNEIEPKIKLLDNIINELMKITKFSREEVYNALYGTSSNIENAYLYLTQKEEKKNDIVFFTPEDDLIIKNDKNEEKKEDMNKLMKEKGEKFIIERKKFLNLE